MIFETEFFLKDFQENKTLSVMVEEQNNTKILVECQKDDNFDVKKKCSLDDTYFMEQGICSEDVYKASQWYSRNKLIVLTECHRLSECERIPKKWLSMEYKQCL